MCLPAAGTAAAAALSSFTSVAGLAISAVSTAVGFIQNQQQSQMAAAQAQQQAALQRRQQQEQANYQYMVAKRDAAYQRNIQQQQYDGQMRAFTAAQQAYQRQIFNNNRAANQSYTAEQMKMNEKAKESAFKSQEVYAKQIGDMGSILATGQVGQSVGALVRDVEAQGGFAIAKDQASLRSAETQSAMQMIQIQQQNESANNQALSALPLEPVAPYFMPDPVRPPGATIGIKTR